MFCKYLFELFIRLCFIEKLINLLLAKEIIMDLIKYLLILLLSVLFIFCVNSSEDIKIKDVCKSYHKDILGWHKSYKLFKKRHIEVSDKSKYTNTNDKTIQKYFLKQKKLLEAINNAEEKLQSLSKVYHYLECKRFEKKFERN